MALLWKHQHKQARCWLYMATQIGITVYFISLLLAEQWSIYFIYDLSIFMRLLKSRTPQAEEWATAKIQKGPSMQIIIKNTMLWSKSMKHARVCKKKKCLDTNVWSCCSALTWNHIFDKMKEMFVCHLGSAGPLPSNLCVDISYLW